MVQLLLEKDAELGSQNVTGWTPLSWAAMQGQDAVVLLQLKKAVDKCSSDQNPLLQAAEKRT